MTDSELTQRIVAASGPPAVDDLTTFLRKRFAERRAEARNLPLGQAQQTVASIDAQEAVLDELDASLSTGKPRPYIDALLYVAGRMGGQFDTHPDYRHGWRP
ncbi:hypothetical protein [Streptomyces syringium]|uniref:hypothetical protein n=1 Tax=Streptomyces syringium TaxID=76729 RepID=UPI003411DFFD